MELSPETLSRRDHGHPPRETVSGVQQTRFEMGSAGTGRVEKSSSCRLIPLPCWSNLSSSIWLSHCVDRSMPQCSAMTSVQGNRKSRVCDHGESRLTIGNYSKVVPVTRIRNRCLPFGPLYTKAQELRWAFAHS